MPWRFSGSEKNAEMPSRMAKKRGSVLWPHVTQLVPFLIFSPCPPNNLSPPLLSPVFLYLLSLAGCDWTNRDFFTARDTSQLITWQDGRCGSDFLSSLPKPDSHVSVATGFGCATIFWYMSHRSAHIFKNSTLGRLHCLLPETKVNTKDV